MTTYATDSEGKFIPASQRPDGTWRKARRVKQGYVPQEEVPLYESKGKQFANRKSTVPPGFCPFSDDAKKEREKQERMKAQKEDAAAKKAQKNKPGILVVRHGAASGSGATKKAPKQQPNASTAAAADKKVNDMLVGLALEDSAEQIGKQLKKLRKKLREIETIEEKIKSGDLKKPEKEQLEKVKRKKEILKDIKRLEEEEAAVASKAETSPSAQ